MLTELRDELRRRGAPTQGRYEELVARLDRLVIAEVQEELEDDDGVGGLSRARCVFVGAPAATASSRPRPRLHRTSTRTPA